jgi:hypothetical protein
MGIFQMLLVAKGCCRGLRVPDPEDNNGAEHDAVVPGLATAHDHAHGPEPETAEAVPVLHRLLVGAAATAVPFAAPHAPFCVCVVGAVTVMANGASDALDVPSVTLITMLEERLPAALAGGLPESSPVLGLKLAQEGVFMMLKVRVLPSGSPATGVNA